MSHGNGGKNKSWAIYQPSGRTSQGIGVLSATLGAENVQRAMKTQCYNVGKLRRLIVASKRLNYDF